MSIKLHLLSFITVFLLLNKTSAGGGYHYNRPSQPISQTTHSVVNTGHHFAPLSTVSPLPPVPTLPPLPTVSVSNHFEVQSLIQSHTQPKSSYTASKSIATAYRPPSALQLPNKYLPSNVPVYTNVPDYSKTQSLRHAEVALEPQSSPSIFGQRFLTGPSFANTPALLPKAQQLRIPFGKQAVVHLPSTSLPGVFYEFGGRHLKQYAVIEIIDNDIELNTQPFTTSTFIHNYRAQIGASGTGSIPSESGKQLDSQSNALVLEQQRLAQQGSKSGSNTIALGSGGLGIVRLPNGNVYLGSGSLGYISAQQHLNLVQEARTRTGAAVPDALHFGHGPLDSPSNSENQRSFRF